MIWHCGVGYLVFEEQIFSNHMDIFWWMLIVFRFGLGCDCVGFDINCTNHVVQLFPIFLSVLFMAWSIPMFHNWFVHFLLLSKKHMDIFQLQNSHKFFFFFTLEFNDTCYSHGWCKLIHLWTVHWFICVVPTFQNDVVLRGHQHNTDT